jgi:hypothetical protein
MTWYVSLARKAEPINDVSVSWVDFGPLKRPNYSIHRQTLPFLHRGALVGVRKPMLPRSVAPFKAQNKTNFIHQTGYPFLVGGSPILTIRDDPGLQNRLQDFLSNSGRMA